MAGIFNCDWFSFTADFEKYNAEENPTIKTTLDPEVNKHLATVFRKLDEEREKPEGGYIDLGLFKFEVYPHGSRRYYYILHNDDFELQLARYRSHQEANYPVYIHFKSQFLWSSLYDMTRLKDKFDLIIEWLEQLIGGRYRASKINRLDLCYHCDDVPHGFNADHFVGRHTLDTTRRTHRVVSGIDIGSRKSEKLFLRCYNKYLETRATKKQWFYPIWMNAGLDVRKVWNIEFQMKREYFRETEINGTLYDTAEQVISGMSAIWLYLTTEWVTYRIPDNDRRTRWSLHPWWTGLYDFVETDDRVTRNVQRELPTEEAIIPALRGYLTSLAARTGDSLEDGTLFKRLLTSLKDYDEKNKTDFDEQSNIKKSLIDPEGWEKYVPIPKAEIKEVSEETSEEIIEEVPIHVAELHEQLELFSANPIEYNRILIDFQTKKEPSREAPSLELQI